MLNDKQKNFLSKCKELKGCGVYEIWSPSGKVYIGQSTNFHVRFKSYFALACKQQRKLYLSFLKHGVENHTFKIVLVEYMKRYDKFILDETEQKLIDFYRNGGVELLNLREGGSTGKFSEESKLRLSLAKKGKNMGSENPNWGKGCFGESNGMFGKNHTKESILKGLKTRLNKYGDVWSENKRKKDDQRILSIAKWKEKVSANASKKGKIPSAQVVQLSEHGAFIGYFESMFKAATSVGIHPSHVSKSVRKNRFAPTTRFRFMYKKDYEESVILNWFIASGLILKTV